MGINILCSKHESAGSRKASENEIITRNKPQQDEETEKAQNSRKRRIVNVESRTEIMSKIRNQQQTSGE
jgi:hypothetical protein